MDNTAQEIRETLYAIFRNDMVKFFTPSDDYRSIAGDNTFISYGFHRYDSTRVIISIGGDDIDTTPIKVCHSATEIENLINTLIY